MKGGPLFERLLKTFKVVDVREVIVDRPYPEVSRSLAALGPQSEPRFPWSDYFTWEVDAERFQILGSRDLQKFRVDGLLQPAGNQTKVTLRSSYNEPVSRFFALLPLLAFAFGVIGLLTLQATHEPQFLNVVIGLLYLTGGACAFSAIFLSIGGFIACSRRPEDLSSVILGLGG